MLFGVSGLLLLLLLLLNIYPGPRHLGTYRTQRGVHPIHIHLFGREFCVFVIGWGPLQSFIVVIINRILCKCMLHVI